MPDATAAGEVEQSSMTQTNGSNPGPQPSSQQPISLPSISSNPPPPPTTNGTSGGGFTAVNGILNKPTHQSPPTLPPMNSTPPREEPKRSVEVSAPASFPASSETPTTNGQPPVGRRDSDRSSPPVNSIYPRRPSSSENSGGHSPPRRKRSYPEAFGDEREDSRTPKKESTPGGDDRYGHDSIEGTEEQKLAAEALRRESESTRRESINGDDRSYQEYERTNSGAIIDLDRKKRKRVFSNRTKTGCMTCRKRKKKCDEMHPECNNCLRGGFVCEGYSTRNTWQKPSAPKGPIPLQSKEGPSTYQHTLTQPTAPSQAPVRYSDDYQSRPELKSMDETRRLSPHHESRPGWSNPPPPYNGPPQPTAYNERPPPPESRPPLPRPDGLLDHPDPSSFGGPSMAQRPGLPPHGPPPPPLQHQLPPAHHVPPPPPSMMGTPQQQHPPIVPPIMDAPLQRPPSHHASESERDKMLRGEYFLPYTSALMADRDQCALAVWRFNNSTNPTMGIKLEDRMKFFRDIVNLRPTHDPDTLSGPPHPNDPPIVGSVGSGVIVEAPFSCDYGYNITIGNDVVIGADCRITDTCSVHIGNNVVFSPGVRLMCATYAIDPKERKKGKGRALGRQIVIEDDVWIGSNVIILPGVKIGRCTTIGAGSLLHKDVPPYVVVAGNPPKVVRGIYDDGRAS